MMFAMAFHADIAEHHHVIVALNLVKGACQHSVRVFHVTTAKLFPSANHPFRCTGKPLTRWVFSNPAQQGLDRSLGLRAAWAP